MPHYVGYLYLRLSQRFAAQLRIGPDYFYFGACGILKAIPAINEGEDSMAVFVQKEGKPFIIFDDAQLYPSDALIIKLLALKD